MPRIPVIGVFDIGKTNKKILLFDEEYHIVFDQSVRFGEIRDEDGDPCEDVRELSRWVKDLVATVVRSKEFSLKAFNVSAYGASFVHVDATGNLMAPLYNYLKAYPAELKEKFYTTYGGESFFSLRTASPALGSLNSGMQLYRLKTEQPDLFETIQHSLHLPQYLSWLITGKAYSDITSIGCHTGLWDFEKKAYHDWVFIEGIAQKLPIVFPSNDVMKVKMGSEHFVAGAGLHDSSAALIPYLANFKEPFILLSTGTWSISMNPFNNEPLTRDELKFDCLCYLDYTGATVKSARLFSGYEHEQQTKRLADYFNVGEDAYKELKYNAEIVKNLQRLSLTGDAANDTVWDSQSSFGKRALAAYKTFEEAYHRLILDLVSQQAISTNLVMGKGRKITRIFVDGGFSKNDIFMHQLAQSFPEQEVFGASVAQATALGAALAIHPHWNPHHWPRNLVELKLYGSSKHSFLK